MEHVKPSRRPANFRLTPWQRRSQPRFLLGGEKPREPWPGEKHARQILLTKTNVAKLLTLFLSGCCNFRVSQPLSELVRKVFSLKFLPSYLPLRPRTKDLWCFPESRMCRYFECRIGSSLWRKEKKSRVDGEKAKESLKDSKEHPIDEFVFESTSVIRRAFFDENIVYFVLSIAAMPDTRA